MDPIHAQLHTCSTWFYLGAAKQCLQRSTPAAPSIITKLPRGCPPLFGPGGPTGHWHGLHRCPVFGWQQAQAARSLLRACMEAKLAATSLQAELHICMHAWARTDSRQSERRAPCTPHPTYSTSTTHWHTSSFIKPVPAQNAASVLHMISVLLFLIFSDEEHKSDWWLAFSPLSFVNY